MSIFDFAIKMEADGKAYYEKLASDTELAGLKTIFSRMAEDEQRHLEIFKELKSKHQSTMAPASSTLAEAKSIFAGLPRASSALNSLKDNLEAYQHCMQVESDSARLYEEAAAKEDDPAIKALLIKIAGEEHEHFNVLANIYHFVNAPNQSLAWGEFSNLDEFGQF